MQHNDQLSPARLYRLLRALVVLKIEKVQLSLSERLTLLCGTLAIAFIGLLFGVAVIVFLSLALVEFLSTYMAIYWCFMIVAGGIVALFAAVYALRDRLIFNPLARFLSRLICEKEL